MDSKWRIRGCTLVRVPSAVCVGLWQLEPPRRKTTTSCLSSRRIPPAHATCFHGNRKKVFSAGHGNVFRSERDTSRNKNQAAERFKLLPSLSQKVPITRLASANSGDADLERERLKQTSTVHRDLRLLIFQQALFLSEKVCLSELISVLA